MSLDRRAKKQRVFALADEPAGGQIEDQTAIHLRIEGEVEVVESPVGDRGSRPVCAAAPAAGRERRVSSSRDQAGDQIDGRHGFGLRLAQAGFQHGGHAAEAELPQGAFEFDEVHALVLLWFCLR